MTAPNDNTPIAIINDAYFDAGLTQQGQTPDSEQIVMGMRKLTDIINLWQTQGLKLWLNVDTTIPLVAGQGTYVLSPTGDVVMPKPPRAITAGWAREGQGRAEGGGGRGPARGGR